MTEHTNQNGITGFQRVLLDGVVNVPFTLLRDYKKHGLNEIEVMVILQLLGFVEKEQKPFPTFDEVAARMAIDQAVVIRTIQKLVKTNWVSIEQRIDSHTQVQFEAYEFSTMYAKLANENTQPVEQKVEHVKRERSLYTLFETEFARPLSPMECETIASWEEQDEYPRELIVHALKESVFAGKLHFRYIDRILLDWHNKKIRTVEQAKQQAQQFRMERK
jgi:DNA replication protein